MFPSYLCCHSLLSFLVPLQPLNTSLKTRHFSKSLHKSLHSPVSLSLPEDVNVSAVVAAVVVLALVVVICGCGGFLLHRNGFFSRELLFCFVFLSLVASLKFHKLTGLFFPDKKKVF